MLTQGLINEMKQEHLRELQELREERNRAISLLLGTQSALLTIVDLFDKDDDSQNLIGVVANQALKELSA